MVAQLGGYMRRKGMINGSRRGREEKVPNPGIILFDYKI